MTVLASLFAGAFLAATLLPFSSEVMLLTALETEAAPVLSLIAVASIGNVLGAMVNWGLGRYLVTWVGHRWFPFSQLQMDRAAARFQRYGTWTLLFSFVPVIGDPLTFAAGVLRVRFWLFVLLVTISKTGRYLLVATPYWAG